MSAEVLTCDCPAKPCDHDMAKIMGWTVEKFRRMRAMDNLVNGVLDLALRGLNKIKDARDAVAADTAKDITPAATQPATPSVATPATAIEPATKDE